MLSSGGIVAPETAGRMPVRMIESGPAAGALGAAFAARALGFDDLLAFDMGGTTAKICLIQEYRPLVTGRFEIDRMYRLKEGSGLPVIVPSIDMIEIGAGGGSIARVDDLGLLKVGPHSAGSRPGPACYALGGIEPTVTDADVVLGLLDPARFLGGAMPLDANAANTAIARLGDKLGVSAVAAARGVYRVVCKSMAGAVRAHAADRGVDCRGIPVLAFGGAGPVHACGVADLLSSSTVVFPPLASVYSAFGALVTPPRLDLVRTSLARLDRIDWSVVDALFTNMEDEGRQALMDAGVAAQDITFEYAADMRYHRQQFELPVAYEERPFGEVGAAMARRCFEEEYRNRYKLIQPEAPVEIVNWRVIVSGPATLAPDLAAPASATVNGGTSRRVDLWNDDEDVPVLPRSALVAGNGIAGPVILEEPQTTLVIPSGWTATLEGMDCVVARRNGQGRA